MTASQAPAPSAATERIPLVVKEVARRIVGQDVMVERLLIGLLTGGHVLIEGVPGLAKTLAVRSLAEIISATFSRIQFTPDLLPPAKVQSALLEAMQEKQVTIGGATFHLTEPFLVLATQNPIENEGTYPLPEAQLDRFMLKVRVGYPSRDEEREILLRMAGGAPIAVRKLLDPATIMAARAEIAPLYADQKVLDYLVDVVRATREPGAVGLSELKPLIAFGASPRASIALAQAARAHAFLRGRSYVVPEDVRALAPDVLRHRIVLTFEAEAEDVDADVVIRRVLAAVPVP
jgi:MoxR-like ATPase